MWPTTLDVLNNNYGNSWGLENDYSIVYIIIKYSLLYLIRMQLNTKIIKLPFLNSRSIGMLFIIASHLKFKQTWVIAILS